MADEVQKSDAGGKKAWPLLMGWVGSASALIGLGASIAGGVAWYQTRHKQQAELQGQMTLADSEAKSGEYQAAVESYGEILKANPLYKPAQDGQLNATMQWVENFHVAATDDATLVKLAIPLLDEIMPVLNAGMAREKGTQNADVQAHLGWAHWLNQHIAEREFGPLTEQNLRGALTTDPANVYAHGMLGNWILQMHGDPAEAIQHLDAAVATGKVRHYVRSLQLNGLTSFQSSDMQELGLTRASLMKAVNDMRVHGEPLSEDSKQRILEDCCETLSSYHSVLVAALGAVPPDDARKTYLWLDDTVNRYNVEVQQIVRRYMAATIQEISGDKAGALAEYRAMQKSEPDQLDFRLRDSIDASIKRLSGS
jgi:hypothetical protein